MARPGAAWRGKAGPVEAGHGTRAGTSARTTNQQQHNRMTKKDWQPFETAPKEINTVVLATWGTRNFVGGYITIAKNESGWEDTLDRTRQFNEVGKNIKDNGYWLLQWTPIAKIFIWS
jgi:hypothetical protein